MPGSVGNTGLAGNHAVRCCRTVSLDFEVIRLKIRLNFVAARNVPVFSLGNAVGSRPHPYQKAVDAFMVYPFISRRNLQSLNIFSSEY
jgi:hypothetical protein